MAGRRHNPNQQRIPFEGADQDASVEFRQKMTDLRDRLKRVTPESTGLTGLRWEQVRELIMAIMSYSLAGRQPELAGMLRTSGLTRDQWYVARENALALGLVTSSRRYTSQRRRVDQLAVDQLAVDQLARGPTKSDQHRLAPNRSDQVRPSPTRIKEDTTRAALDLPNNPSSTTSTRGRTKKRELQKTIEEVEEAVKKIGVDCRKLKAAVREAVRAGKCSRQELIERVAWFGQRLNHYAPEHRGGALCEGLRAAKRGMNVREGWPYSENFLEQEARRDREREKQRLAAEQQRASRRAVQDSFERSRQRERDFGPTLNALSDDELHALEMQCFHSKEWADNCRGLSAYRDVILTALENRAQEGTIK